MMVRRVTANLRRLKGSHFKLLIDLKTAQGMSSVPLILLVRAEEGN
jgi:hypothetical protein